MSHPYDNQTRALLSTIGAALMPEQRPNQRHNPNHQDFPRHNNRGGFRNFRGNAGFDAGRVGFNGGRGGNFRRGSHRGHPGFSTFKGNNYDAQSQPINITIAPPQHAPTAPPPAKRQNNDGEKTRKNPKNSKNPKNTQNAKTSKPDPKPPQPAALSKPQSRMEWKAKQAAKGMVNGVFPRDRMLSILFIGKCLTGFYFLV